MKVDIISQKPLADKRAYKVKDDAVLNLFRAIKKYFGILKGNELYVGESNLEAYKKKRKEFMNTLLFISLIEVIVLFFGFLLPLFSLDIPRAISGLVISIVLAIILFLFALLRYMPSINEQYEIIDINQDINSNEKNKGK